MTSHDELRDWAKGRYTTEAATELLIRAFDGRFARAGSPWIETSQEYGNSWINFEAIPDTVGGVSGGERRFLLIAASIADVGVSVELGDVIPGLDRKVLDLVLAAIAHAGGSHEHSGFVYDEAGNATHIERQTTLYSWPA